MQLLPRIVGLQRAKEIIFSGRVIGAEEAKNLGIVHEIVPQDDALAIGVAFAERFRNAPTEAIGMAKIILNQSFNLDRHALLAECLRPGGGTGNALPSRGSRRFPRQEAARLRLGTIRSRRKDVNKVQRAAITGVADTAVGKLEGSTSLGLQAEAAAAAVADAGLSLGDIDGVLCGYSFTEPHLMLSSVVSEFLGIMPSYSIAVQAGGAPLARR